MTTKNKIKASETSLNQILDRVVESNEPLVIDAEDKSFVVVTENEWNSLRLSYNQCDNFRLCDLYSSYRIRFLGFVFY